MDNLSFTRDLVLVLGTAFLGGFLAKRLRQPLLTGYVLGGVIVSGLLSQFLKFDANLATLADIGAAFLMFTLGLEFSWSLWRKIGPEIFLAATVQILAMILFSILWLPRFGFDFYSSLFLGSAFSLSSTAVVVKILQDKGELETLAGNLSVGWLLIQDLAVLPMIILLPVLAPSLRMETNFFPSLLTFFQAIFKAVLLLFLLVLVFKRFMPWLTAKILKTQSRELLLLFVVSFCLVVAFGTASLGLSFALGAFLAGFLVADLGISVSIFAEIRPLRDIFAVIFFVTLGFLIRPEFLLAHLKTIFFLTIILLTVKFLLVVGIVLYLKYHSKTTFLTGIYLAQIGEFAFVLGQMGVRTGSLSQEMNLTIISVTLLSLILTPWLINGAPNFYRKIKNASSHNQNLAHLFAKFDQRPQATPPLPFENHVVILGFGRVGKYIGRALQMSTIPFVVVDYNQETVQDLKDKGLNVVYGDPSEIEILDYAQVDKAKALVIAIPDRQSQEMIITNAQTLSPGVKIICRSHYEEDQAILRALKVETIIQPEFEAALSIINKLLTDFGLEEKEIAGKIKRLKIEHGLL